MAQGGSTMNNKHILTEIREDGIATVTPNRVEVHNAFVAELPMTVTGIVTRRVPSQQMAEEALLRRNPG
jgi:1,4-dihydroxy-2-naphthoyl-CoA synthase